MNSHACAACAARSTSASLASGRAYAMFSRMLPLKSTGSCGTIPIAPRNVLKAVVDRAHAMGFEAYSALELEFYLFDEPLGMEHDADIIGLSGLITPSTPPPRQKAWTRTKPTRATLMC